MASDTTGENTLFDTMKKIHNAELDKINQDAVTEYEESTFTIQSTLENKDVVLTELIADGTIVCSYWDDAINHVILNEVHVGT